MNERTTGDFERRYSNLVAQVDAQIDVVTLRPHSQSLLDMLREYREITGKACRLLIDFPVEYNAQADQGELDKKMNRLLENVLESLDLRPIGRIRQIA